MQFTPTDTKKWVTTFDSKTGKRDAILIEVIDEENARVWFPQVKRSDGSRGAVAILTPEDIIEIGPDVELKMVCF